MPRLNGSQNLELTPRQLQLLQTLLSQHVPDAEVWAFGSRVHGGAHEGSDLDLVVRNPACLTSPVQGWLALKESLQESSLPMLVEVHDWAQLPAGLQRNIEQSYVVLKDGRVPG